MLLEEAIQHCEEKALCGNACGLEHKQLADWLRELIQLRYQNERLLIIVHRQKYKRCLATAKWCDEVMMSCELRGYTVHRIWANKHQWAMRWKYRWLELAEKFKEGV